MTKLISSVGFAGPRIRKGCEGGNHRCCIRIRVANFAFFVDDVSSSKFDVESKINRGSVSFYAPIRHPRR